MFLAKQPSLGLIEIAIRRNQRFPAFDAMIEQGTEAERGQEAEQESGSGGLNPGRGRIGPVERFEMFAQQPKERFPLR